MQTLKNWKMDFEDFDINENVVSNVIRLSDDGKTILFVSRNIESLIIPNVELIKENRFYNYYKLQTVIMDSVKVIEDWAFSSCFKLLSVDIPNVSKIKYGAFAHCSFLHTINMPNVNQIDDHVFYGCDRLININSKLNNDQLKYAFGSEKQYNNYTQRNRDYKLSLLLE